MPIDPIHCRSIADPLDCETDSVTVCPPDDDAPFHVIIDGGATADLQPGFETAITGVAVMLLAANPARKKLIIQNTGLANVRIGTAAVTATTGIRLIPNGSMLLESPDTPINAIWAIRETGVDTIVLSQEIT